MSTTQQIIDAVAANLAQPKRARTDAGEVEQHDLAQQIAAARFAISAASAGTPFRRLRFAQTVAPNASGAADPQLVADIFPPPGMAGLPGYTS